MDDADVLQFRPIRCEIVGPSSRDCLGGGIVGSADGGGGGGSLCVGGALGGCIRDTEAWRITTLVVELDASWGEPGIFEYDGWGDIFR